MWGISITIMTQYVCKRLRSDYSTKKNKKKRLWFDYLANYIKNYNQIFYICKPTKDLEL